jgi:hypothetical protein
LITADAVKRRLPALAFESAVIAPIIVKPQAEKNCRHQQTVKNGGAGEIKHALELGRGAAGGARISMKLSSGANALLECRTGLHSRVTFEKNKKSADSNVGALK